MVASFGLSKKLRYLKMKIENQTRMCSGISTVYKESCVKEVKHWDKIEEDSKCLNGKLFSKISRS